MVVAPHRAVDWVYLTGVVFLAAGASWEIYRRRMAGPVLLDCGGNSRGEIKSGVGTLMLVLGCVALLSEPRGRFQGLFYLGWGVSMLLTPARRFQICQSGIFGRRLFRWEEIEEYYLSPKGVLALKLRGKDWTPSGGCVPCDEWRQANVLLASRLPAQRVVFAA